MNDSIFKYIKSNTGSQLSGRIYDNDVFDYTNAVCDSMLNGGINERVSLFWMDFFPVKPRKIDWMFKYKDVIQANALTSFKLLLIGLFNTPAWIHFLDGHNSHKNSPNENLARELLELYTVGPQNYSKLEIEKISSFLCGLRIDWSVDNESIYWEINERLNTRISLYDKEVDTLYSLVNVLTDNKMTARNIVVRAIDFFNLVNDPVSVECVVDDYYNSDYSNSVLFDKLFSLEQNSQCVTIHPVYSLTYFEFKLGLKFIGNKVRYEILKECGFDFTCPPNVKTWGFGERKPTLFHIFAPFVFFEIKNRKIDKDSVLFKFNSRIQAKGFITYRYRWDVEIPCQYQIDDLAKTWYYHGS